MGKKEIIKMCMDSPLYFSMSIKMRLELVKWYEESHSSNGLIWVKRGRYHSSDQDAFF